MLIRLGYDIELQLSLPMTVIGVLNVHPSRNKDLREPDELQISPPAASEKYTDGFGNICTRIAAPEGPLRLSGSTLIEDSGNPDATDWEAPQLAISNLPGNPAIPARQPLLRSGPSVRSCMAAIRKHAAGLGSRAGHMRLGASAYNIRLSLRTAHENGPRCLPRTAGCLSRLPASRDNTVPRDAYPRSLCHRIPRRHRRSSERRDGLQHWYEVYLGDRWWSFDARNHKPRIGRVLMATGRDAADVALTTSFGTSWLNRFSVVTDEVVDSAPLFTAIPTGILTTSFDGRIEAAG